MLLLLEHGLKQLAKYLDSEGLDHGYLVVYDRREQPAQEDHGSKELEVEGKRIRAWIL
ncbi:MAG: hypothetical protein ACE5IY_03320 [bacterium]